MLLQFQGYEVVSAKADFDYLVRILVGVGTACMFKDNVIAIALQVDVPITSSGYTFARTETNAHTTNTIH